MENETLLNFSLPSIEDGFLDYIDEKCILFGTVGIPNQEKTNQLWEEFQNFKNNG